MTGSLILLIWVGMGTLIWCLTLASLRNEPTAHGQIVGRQLGLALAIMWPIALAYFLVISPLIVREWWRLRR